jgi:hypothetical protein
MLRKKVAQSELNGKSLIPEKYDHYVAIDWSIQIMAIAHMTTRRKLPQVFERPTNLKELKTYLSTLHGRIVLTIEETTTSQWLFLELLDYVDRIIICDPFRNRLLCHGPKTDKIDAGKLCLLLYNGMLSEVFHSTSELYELRILVGAYVDHVQAGVRCQNQKSALLRGHQDQSSTALFILKHLESAIERYRATKEEYEKHFATIVRKHKLLRNLISVDGIGNIGATKILACVVDARRFPNRGKYYGYCGLARHEKSSGGRSYGSRKPRFNHMLKDVYKTAASAVIGSTKPLNEYYEALLSKGVAEHNARHAVARYIARVSLAIIKSGQPYDPYRWRKNVIEQDIS